jgi:Na+/H+ antiporter NhaA
MSIFIASLGVYGQQIFQTARIAIIISSLIAGLGSYFWLRTCGENAAPCQTRTCRASFPD